MNLGTAIDRLIMPEPEVVQSILASANHKSLAGIICALINENEPLLKAEHDGATVTVRERGGAAVMLVTVSRFDSSSRDGGCANNAPSTDK